MEADRYLTNERGQRVDRRWIAGLLSFGALLVTCPLFCLGAGGGMAESPALAVCGFGGGAVLLIAGVVGAWVLIFRVAKRLNAAQELLQAGDPSGAVPRAQEGLMLAFRADFRTKGFHLLGLCAERLGDHAAAAHLFERARAALPAMAAPIRKRRATVLIESHRAIALANLGRVEESAEALRNAASSTGGTKGAADLLLDDGDWGLGSISVNSVLTGIERRADPEALLQLANAVLAHRRGDFQGALHLLHADEARLARGLEPHEQQLARRLSDECRAGLSA